MENQPNNDNDVEHVLNDSSVASNENGNDNWLQMNSTIGTEYTFTGGSELEPPGAAVGVKKVKFRGIDTCPDCFPNQCHCGTSLSIELGPNWEYDSNQLEDESTENESLPLESGSNIDENSFVLLEKSINREESPSPIPPSRFSKRKRSDSLETQISTPRNDTDFAGKQGEELYGTPVFKLNQIRFTPPLSSTPKVNRPNKVRSELGEATAATETTASSITSLAQKLNFLQ